MLPRPIYKGATYLVTRRTTQRQFLLRPCKEINQAFLYCLARAANVSRVLLHAVLVMSNHYHIVCTDPDGTLPLFTETLNKLVARCLNAYHGRDENFWAGGVQPSQVLLDGPAEILDKTVYALVNPVAAGLVKSGKDWPGVLLYQPGGYRAKRPDFFFRSKGDQALPEALELEIVAPPIADHPSQAAVQVAEAVAAAERALRLEFRREGRTFLGSTRVRSQEPTSSPTTAAPRRRLSPKLSSKDTRRRFELIAALRAFADAHQAARRLWVAGVRNVIFPPGTYAMRVRHAVACADT